MRTPDIPLSEECGEPSLQVLAALLGVRVGLCIYRAAGCARASASMPQLDKKDLAFSLCKMGGTRFPGFRLTGGL